MTCNYVAFYRKDVLQDPFMRAYGGEEIVRMLCDVTVFPNRTRKPFDPRLHMRIDFHSNSAAEA